MAAKGMAAHGRAAQAKAAEGRAARSAPSEQAARAATSAGVRIEVLHAIELLEQAAALFGQIWREDSNGVISAHTLKALDLSDNYVSGAFDNHGAMVGASAAWAGAGHRPELYSHVTGVVPERAGAGVGYALKLHQRSWALERGIEHISWTFDPLVRRNAFFNLAKLAARPRAYLENVYGQMTDSINAGGDSDRLLVGWDLRSEAVRAAGDGTPLVADADGLPVAVGLGGDGGPVANPVAADASESSGYVVKLPKDIEKLRVDSPATANLWRLALRQALAESLAGGEAVVAISKDYDLVVMTAAPPDGSGPKG
jgi:predicted GNAT superfamily acetyltransferase